MIAWHITDWERLYEVDEKGRPWTPDCGRPKRKSSFRYVRLYVFGPNGDNMAYEETSATVADKYGAEAWAVCFGLFAKLLELASRGERKERGYLLGKGGRPISTLMLVRITGFTQEQVETGLMGLSDPDVDWIEQVEPPLKTDLPGNSAELPETPGNVRESGVRARERARKLNLTKRKPKPNLTQLNETKGAEDDAGSPAADARVSLEKVPGDSGFASTETEPDTTPAKVPRLDVFTVKFTEAMFKLLGIGRGNAPQYRADRTCFRRMAADLHAGKLGPIEEATERVFRTAKNIGGDPQCANKAGKMLDAFKRELAEHGHTWTKTAAKARAP